MHLIIAIPAYNEEPILSASLTKLYDFCQKNISGHTYKIVIADNNSSDSTSEIGKKISQQFEEIDYLFVSRQGKGAAIRAAWDQNEGDVYFFMDADLATDLSALAVAVELMEQGSQVVIGSRFHPRSLTKRLPHRRLTSMAYRLALRTMLGTKINDAPCGFKAVSREVKYQLLHQVENNGWFFDSELVLRAEKAGYKIIEIPVKWKDPREGKDKTRVKLGALTREYLKEIMRMRKG